MNFLSKEWSFFRQKNSISEKISLFQRLIYHLISSPQISPWTETGHFEMFSQELAAV